MNHIIADFTSFTLNKNIMVYMDGKCIDQAKVSANAATQTILGFVNKYGINQIDLVGHKAFVEKFKTDLISNFSNQHLNIDIYVK